MAAGVFLTMVTFCWHEADGRAEGGFLADVMLTAEDIVPTLILKVPTHVLGRSVLLVEDELMIAWDLEQTLTAAGLRVLGPAASVASALEILKTARPDAAILDLNLRGELVTPVARKLRQMGVPFVLSTAYNHLRDENEAAFTGITNLGKPLASTRCVQVLGEILG